MITAPYCQLLADTPQDIIFWRFVRLYFALVSFRSVFHALDDFGIKGVSFFRKFVHTFRIRFRDI
jgi:hypothetical protein